MSLNKLLLCLSFLSLCEQGSYSINQSRTYSTNYKRVGCLANTHSYVTAKAVSLFFSPDGNCSHQCAPIQLFCRVVFLYLPLCRQLNAINTANAKHLTLANCMLQGHAGDGVYGLPHHGILCYYGQPPQETTKMFLFQPVQTSPHFQTQTSWSLLM